ncbi:MAG TPA: GatB/YqeY domain-containing protein, partial [Steroidobacteraceae bacterium]|nr:GatB/YqeY domain-containing protein [Steroidobacteraceae bacterium]
MKSAMRSGDKERLATIRLILAAIKQREVDERITLDDVQVLTAIEKMAKQRKESIVQLEAGGRADLVAKETAELAVLTAYQPTQLAEAEVDQLIASA